MDTTQARQIVRASAGPLLIAAAVAMVCIGMAIGQQQLAPLQKNRQVYLKTPAPPDTIPVAQPDWDYFAWNSFVAMNWPALEVVPNHYRGIPNTSKQFATAANSDLAVWETFKEKREVFNHPKTAGQLLWYSPVDYGTLRQGNRSIAPGNRVFHQNSGASQPPDGLDETIEVQSQALEQTYPDGKTPNPVFNAVPPVVTPRVWRGPPSAKNPIVYEVKVNYDYFNYVVSKGFNVDNSAPNNPVATAAMNANIHLPDRTSSHIAGGGQNKPVLDYRAATAAADFQAINNIYNVRQNQTVPPPPRQGSIQIKAAWLKLAGAGAKPEDYPTWHTAVAQNYISDAKGNPVPSEPTLFGLVGLHIIQRIHTTDPNNPLDANGPGGTFIYATWEHESIFNSPVVGQPNQPKPTYFYSNFYAGQALLSPPHKGFYPPLDQPAYPVVREYPVLDNTKQVTAIFHRAIAAINPKSVWLHYHLVGTQFQAVDLREPVLQSPPRFPISPNDPTGIGQPVFMANLAVETNLGLRFFKGQPPQIIVIQNFQPPLTSNSNPVGFARHNANTAYTGKGFNMGGCMGCHGIAQSKGYGFSFVLLDGYLGAVTDTQEHFNQPGANP